MEKSKLDIFLEEFQELQEKHGIYVAAGYEEHIDYSWDEEPYVGSVESFLEYLDKEGFEIKE